MSQQRLIRVRPTKIELIRLKRRLSLARRVHGIVKDRLLILTMEFLQVAKENIELREELVEKMEGAYRALGLALGYHGSEQLDRECLVTGRDLKISASTKNVMGVRCPMLEVEGLRRRAAERGYSLFDTSAHLDEAAGLFEESLEIMVELGELKKTLDLLGLEIARTKRVTNALEHILIPRIMASIKYLQMKFEEREREEKVRLKRLKIVLSRR